MMNVHTYGATLVTADDEFYAEAIENNDEITGVLKIDEEGGKAVFAPNNPDYPLVCVSDAFLVGISGSKINVSNEYGMWTFAVTAKITQ